MCFYSLFIYLYKHLQPQFRICVHNVNEDVWVSDSIMKFGYWEVELAQWLNKLLVKLGTPSDVLYIDLGANLGIHSLHAAKANCTVWSVEPQEKNLHKVICVIATFVVPETYFMLPINQYSPQPFL